MFFYLDPATIRKNGDLRRVWELLDNKEQASDGVLSKRALREYDCNREQWRTLSLSGHSGPIASGNILFDYSHTGTWNYVPPNTIAESALRLVCAP